MIEASIVADSISNGVRLTTFKLRYPKFIHGELMTHRVFSRNASSSRAVPTAKLIEEARSDVERARPVEWGKNQKGMQAGEALSGEDLELAMAEWQAAALSAAHHAERMAKLGVHKQIANRIIEPFTHINVVVSATEFMNWFGLRLHADAQPEARALAKAMWPIFNKSEPIERGKDDWHLPYVTEPERKALTIEGAVKVSVARCARTSYESFETKRMSSVEEDFNLFDKLLANSPIHASPAEHQARPAGPGEDFPYLTGNFTGWVQYRKTIKGEAIAPLPKDV